MAVRRLGTLLGFFLASAPGLAQEVPYSFTPIAHTSGPFSGFTSEGGMRQEQGPVINAAGTVAFLGALDSGGEGVFKGSGGPTTTIAETSAGFLSFSETPSINDAGTVAFLGFPEEGAFSAILAGDGGPLETLADDQDVLFDIFDSPSINSAGVVAFYGQDDDDVGLFKSDEGRIRRLYVEFGDGYFFLQQDPAINDSETVAFQGEEEVGVWSIFRGAGGRPTTIADIDGPFSEFAQDDGPSLNNQGTVGFWARLDEGEQGVFTGSGGATTTLADSRGPFASFSETAPSLNDVGGAAFQAQLDAGGSGIFTGSDPVADRVIGVGDVLYGSTVVRVEFSDEALNDAGQLGFYAALANGSEGIFRASPGGAVDAERDGVPDAADNCMAVANPDQRDSNRDGYGNLCDADLDDSGTVDFLDLGRMKADFFSTRPDADLNGDGFVDFLDLGTLKALFFRAPGPSGRDCAGTIPCPQS